ncbi:hypothetical protein F2Q68_00045940 [Brassica cretica]|uniref:Uncharacterized protein n=1 Tax=Brassica cretica TaxID=69181 RepID=A0A8S9LKA9_BRACR|nr:hypothetical protein F2Q68_00045940 [Brassica cretica]
MAIHVIRQLGKSSKETAPRVHVLHFIKSPRDGLQSFDVIRLLDFVSFPARRTFLSNLLLYAVSSSEFILSLRSIATSDLHLHHLSGSCYGFFINSINTDIVLNACSSARRILDSLRFPSSPSPSIIAAPLADEQLGFLQLVQSTWKLFNLTSIVILRLDLQRSSKGRSCSVLYFGLICKEVAKVVPAQTLAATNLADQELTETMQKLLIVMQRLDDKIGLMLESDGEFFNKRWGFFSRALLWDKRYLMRQIEKYADIYTSRVSNFLNYTPFMYFHSQEQVVDAVLSVKMTNQRGEIKYPIKGINILKAHGQSVRDSYLLKGYALNTGSAAQGCH